MLSKEKELIHLLKRSLQGYSLKDFAHFTGKSKSETIHELLNDSISIPLPLKDYSAVNENNPDFKIAFGETWVNDINLDPQINARRKQSLKKWIISILFLHHRSLRPRMWLFWQYYYPLQLSKISIATKAYDYYLTLFHHSLENYKELLSNQITSFAWLEYHKKIKKGNVSVFRYQAHKILQNCLFGPEYETYISKDRIKKFTRLLNEWSHINDNLVLTASKRSADINDEELRQYNNLNLPDIFLQKPVLRDYMSELQDFISRLLQHEKVAELLSQRLYQWFVHPDIETQAARDMIHSLTNSTLVNQYDIKNILTTLFNHENFYTIDSYGALPKTPIYFLTGICHELDCVQTATGERLQNYPLWEWILTQAEWLDQPIGENDYPSPTPVENDQSGRRNLLINRILQPGSALETELFRTDLLAMIDLIPDAEDLNNFLTHLINFLCPVYFTWEKKTALKAFLKEHFHITEQNWKSKISTYKKVVDKNDLGQEIKQVMFAIIRYILDEREYQQF